VVVPHFGFASLFEYYHSMCNGDEGMLPVAIPLLFVHACDDPIIDAASYECVVRGHDNPNLFTRMTRKGGHVGWCEGWWPVSKRWAFMCRCVEDFADAVLAELHSQKEQREQQRQREAHHLSVLARVAGVSPSSSPAQRAAVASRRRGAGGGRPQRSRSPARRK
jgi:hypothetical protein